MFQIVKSYLKFLWNSKNEHGVHSPFVFDLVTKCFYDKKNYPEYSILKNYRNSVLTNNQFIEVTDFGAGSRVFKSNKRQVSQIAKTAGISRKRAELLFRITNYFQPSTILEIGTSLGLATSALSLGNPKAKITTLEGCPNTLSEAKKNFTISKLQNVDFINTKFPSYLKNIKSENSNFKLIYFDGNHSKTATLDYFKLLLPTITNDSVWIFDDIHWSIEMEQAWEIIKKHPKVTVTIDTFQWGIVFFRSEQEKEDFVIRV
ncbi:O-methyltransferase [Flavobacterium capsici]|uniref:Class I SAM-dependent methyltransferase n=1 Tax=Flavobacterium capsici TaxID=3075618 RepID=A0AA96EUS5_9FLAO|nr:MULTISPECIES: class I SAM-dependent methyltransferase [unclassified Flavobacterium]WNM18933.1 class I SAM-dependent methyltransferase [Flavobacterium sp. PMR2A8]WNM22983.1 class I SAM-dependent methyltransferase [Flavobacterium sp. PMTSA4]